MTAIPEGNEPVRNEQGAGSARSLPPPNDIRSAREVGLLAAPLTWAEIVDHCSRLHTTRTRPLYPGADEQAEGSQMLDIWVTHGRRLPAVVVPTRMHEPGFYVRCPNGYEPDWMWRSDDDLERFHSYVDAGKVTRRD